MEARKLIEMMSIAELLKNTMRHSWTSNNRQESVAEHSWRLALLAYFVKDEFPEADIHKVILMSLCHDLGEAFTGDIPVFEKTDEDRTKEEKFLSLWLASLPSPYCYELGALICEIEAQESLESKLFHALDKMEVLIQHNEAHLSTWLPLEHSLNLCHGEKEVEFSEYMKALRMEIKKDTLKKLEHAQVSEKH